MPNEYSADTHSKQTLNACSVWSYTELKWLMVYDAGLAVLVQQ